MEQQANPGARDASEERKSSHLIKSIGGCLTEVMMDMCRSPWLRPQRHFWRRPTIALMAQAISPPFIPEHFPKVLTRYIRLDCQKSHLTRILDGACDVLIFDLTRDVMCGVLDFGEDRYIADPIALKGSLTDDECPTRNDITAILPAHSVRSIDDSDYFDIWCYAFERFVTSMKPFRKLILNRLYYTDQSISPDTASFVDSDAIRRANFFLDVAYDHVENHYPEIAINKVDRRLMLTAEDVPWGGPHWAHLLPETTAIFVDGICKILNPSSNRGSTTLLRVTFERLKKQEGKWFEILAKLTEAERIGSEASKLLADQDNLLNTFRDETRRLNERLEQIRAERDSQIAQSEDMVRMLDKMQGESDHLKIEVEQLKALVVAPET